MIQIRNFADPRQTELCAYCATLEKKLTKDHTPSKIFLNKPYPENMHIVPACFDCNNNFSSDEEYLSYWIEMALFEQKEVKTDRYKKAVRALERNISLKKNILGDSLFKKNDIMPLDESRFCNIVFKLASGHILFKHNTPQYEMPTSIKWFYFQNLNNINKRLFEQEPQMDVFPEVGSRTIIKIDELGLPVYSWEIVQPDIYRYLVANIDDDLVVKIIFSEFLACEAIWREES